MASKREKELEAILSALTPAVRDILWCALVWNDHNFEYSDLTDKARRAAKSLGHESGTLGDSIPAVNAWMERVDKVLSETPAAWVSTSENPPPIDETVLGWRDGVFGPSYRYKHSSGKVLWSFNGAAGGPVKGPAYWMPLPASPESEEARRE